VRKVSGLFSDKFQPRLLMAAVIIAPVFRSLRAKRGRDNVGVFCLQGGAQCGYKTMIPCG